MSQIGSISPLECDVEKLKEIAKNNGRLCFSIDDKQENWLTPEGASEEFAARATEAIINSINGTFKIYVNEKDFYKVGM